MATTIATRDPEELALRSLAEAMAGGVPEKPLEALEQVAGLARSLTDARYAALVVIDGEDNVEGFVTAGLTAAEERRLKAPPSGHGPLGTMRQDGLAVRIDELGEHAKAFGFPPRHPEMRTLLGVPIWKRGAVSGALYVTDRNGGKPFRDGDEVVLLTLARHASHVIDERWY